MFMAVALAAVAATMRKDGGALYRTVAAAWRRGLGPVGGGWGNLRKILPAVRIRTRTRLAIVAATHMPTSPPPSTVLNIPLRAARVLRICPVWHCAGGGGRTSAGLPSCGAHTLVRATRGTRGDLQRGTGDPHADPSTRRSPPASAAPIPAIRSALTRTRPQPFSWLAVCSQDRAPRRLFAAQAYQGHGPAVGQGTGTTPRPDERLNGPFGHERSRPSLVFRMWHRQAGDNFTVAPGEGETECAILANGAEWRAWGSEGQSVDGG